MYVYWADGLLNEKQRNYAQGGSTLAATRPLVFFCLFLSVHFFIGDNIGQKEQLLKRNLHISRCKNNGRCKIGVRFIYLRYAWFSENMRKNAEEKIEKKNRKKKK